MVRKEETSATEGGRRGNLVEESQLLTLPVASASALSIKSGEGAPQNGCAPT